MFLILRLCYLVLSLAFLLVPLTYAQEAGVPLQLYSEIHSITEAGYPRIFDNNIIFTYETAEPARSVYAIFEHEAFRTFHQFALTQENEQSSLFILAIPVPQESYIRYRFVVDSTWVLDPDNPNTVGQDEPLSLFIIPQNAKIMTYKPSSDKNTTTFRLSLRRHNQNVLRTVDARLVAVDALPKKGIYIAGSFNSWDPFLFPMKKNDESTYEITLRLKPGRYFYYFVVDGHRILDPENNELARSGNHGYLVSAYTVP